MNYDKLPHLESLLFKSRQSTLVKSLLKSERLTTCKAPMLCAMQLSSIRSFTFFSKILIFSSGLQEHDESETFVSL